MSEPHPFLWGVATSAHQIEGHNEHNDWWAWEAKGHVEGGARSGAATDHYQRWSEDLDLAKSLGLTSYRFSIEWSRIEPHPGEWNEGALQWYLDLIQGCEQRGLVPMATLHHFTSPRWFAEAGGFTAPESPERFAAFVRVVAERLGYRIPLWCTLNEPMVLALGSYVGKFMPPAEYSPIKATRACRNLLRAHALAYDILHSNIVDRQGPWKHWPIQVGIAHNLLDFRADRRWHPLERLLAGIFRRFYNRAWLDAVTGRPQHFGVYGLLPYAKPVREALGRRTADFIGVNYYTKAYVRWRPRDTGEAAHAKLPIGLAFARRTEEASDLGWAHYPKGLGRMLRLAAGYGLPLYVTENGVADRDDRLRPRYLLAHLNEIDRARAEGIDIRGYYHWSLLDNFEWIKGFWPRFGLFRVDYDTLAREPTSSARVYRDWIREKTDGKTAQNAH